MDTDCGPTCSSVLVVDDDPNVLKVISTILLRSGYAVTATEDCAAAEKLIESSVFDVILSDINLAERSGMDVLRCARAHEPGVPVIMLTGSPDLQSAMTSVQFGAFRYLTKPFELTEIVDVVSKAAASGRRSARAYRVVAEQELEHEARRLLLERFDRACDSLFMAYQPIVCWPTRTVSAYEALLRTKEPSLPHPGAVLAAASQLGRTSTLGRAIRRRVAADCANRPVARVFVNLVSSDLLDDELYDPASPLSAIAEHVVLELTERDSLVRVQDVRGRVAKLRALGFKLAIDDLGEGYSSLNSLALIEPEVIKLDMAIVRGVTSSRANRGLIRSMADFARDVGAELVAEGVETIAERDALLELGCGLFQGYLFARPASDFPAVSW